MGFQGIRWPVARFQFDFEVTASIHLPHYGGSTIRGSFGRALRRTCCMTRMKKCLGCPLFRGCPYTSIFESPASVCQTSLSMGKVPNPYVVEAPEYGERIYAPGEHLVFEVVLIGRAIEKLPIVIYAFQQAFARDVGYGKAKLCSVSAENPESGCFDVIYTGSGNVAYSGFRGFELLPMGDEVSIHIRTPLRLQNNGHILGSAEFSSYSFFISLLRRVSLLFVSQVKWSEEGFLQILIDEIKNVSVESDLKRVGFIRYSSRQKQKMNLDGVVGEAHFKNISPDLQILLRLGTWLHVGKNATFGLGRYSIEADN